jgi:hypothetical protein
MEDPSTTYIRDPIRPQAQAPVPVCREDLTPSEKCSATSFLSFEVTAILTFMLLILYFIILSGSGELLLDLAVQAFLVPGPTGRFPLRLVHMHGTFICLCEGFGQMTTDSLHAHRCIGIVGTG